jgi:hypothetical protein
MSQVLVELNVPADWKRFKLPPALDLRLQSLLDKLGPKWKANPS